MLQNGAQDASSLQVKEDAVDEKPVRRRERAMSNRLLQAEGKPRRVAHMVAMEKVPTAKVVRLKDTPRLALHV